uniref:Uncharacterized protein n=1 Tax=Arundo donax TaxID=35708 RepID=A0A0A8YBM5_ARUDO
MAAPFPHAAAKPKVTYGLSERRANRRAPPPRVCTAAC